MILSICEIINEQNNYCPFKYFFGNENKKRKDNLT